MKTPYSVAERAGTSGEPRVEWQVLSEFALQSEPGSETQVLAKVAEAIEALHRAQAAAHPLPPALREALSAALARSRQQRPASLLVMRVLIAATEPAQAPRATRQGADATGGEPAQQRTHACGFFLVDRMAGTGDAAHQATDIFLYVEGRAKQENSRRGTV